MKITKNTSVCRKQNTETIIKSGKSVEHKIQRNRHSGSRMIETYNINTNKKTSASPINGPVSDADILIIDLNIAKEIETSNLTSRTDFSLYDDETI